MVDIGSRAIACAIADVTISDEAPATTIGCHVAEGFEGCCSSRSIRIDHVHAVYLVAQIGCGFTGEAAIEYAFATGHNSPTTAIGRHIAKDLDRWVVAGLYPVGSIGGSGGITSGWVLVIGAVLSISLVAPAVGSIVQDRAGYADSIDA